MIDKEDIRKKKAQELIKNYYVQNNRKNYFADLENMAARLPNDYKRICESFIYNLNGVLSTVSMPVAMVSIIVSNYRVHELFRHHGMKQIIDGVISAKHIDAKIEAEWYEAAGKLYEEEIASKGEAFHGITDRINDLLLRIHKHKEFEIAASELILQGVVLTWGAFEVLCRDFFISYINLNPSKAYDLIANENTKKYYDRKNIDIELLHNYNYNLSTSMGEVLCEMHDLVNINSIRNIYKSLFNSNDNLTQKLIDSNIWFLNQKRHLIVHQMGIVDKKFIDNTGLDIPIGSKLKVTPETLENYIFAVKDTGFEILNNVCP